MINFLPGRLKYMTGDATVPESGGHRIIIQINNDLGVIGVGFSGAINRRWPKVGEEYKRWFRSQVNFKGGEIQMVSVQSDTFCANMIAQHGIMSKNTATNIPLRLDQLAQCLEKVAVIAKQNGSSIHTARIGAGLAAGVIVGYDPEIWTQVEQLLIEKFINKGINVTVYDLPKKDAN